MSAPKKQGSKAPGSEKNSPAKRTYVAPKLQAYGQLAELTRGSTGTKGDGGTSKRT
jgi:hypothetical protein